MKSWQFNVLFFIMAAGAVFLMFADKLGIPISPTALTGYGAITTYVLTQRSQWTRMSRGDDAPPSKDEKKPGTHKAGDGDEEA